MDTRVPLCTRPFTALFIAACCLLSEGCEQTNPLYEAMKGITILPTAVGNKWVYDVQFFDSTGQRKPFPSHEVALEITESIIIADEQWFVFGTQIVRNKPDALWKLENNLHEVLYKFPAHKGYSYRVDGTVVTVAEVDFPLSIYGGTLQCHRYEYRYSGSDFVHAIHYCAPYIGLIRVETFDLTSDNRRYLTMAMELKSVILK